LCGGLRGGRGCLPVALLPCLLLEFIMRSFLLFVCLRRGFGVSFSCTCGHMLNAWGRVEFVVDMSTTDLFLLATSKAKS